MCVVTAAEILMEDLCYLGQLSMIVNFYSERVTDVENKLMVTKGERGGRDKLGGWD